MNVPRAAQTSELVPSVNQPADKSLQENRAWKAFVANKKQELLAPVNAMLELTEILLKDVQDRGQGSFAEDLAQIHLSAGSLLGMVQKLLDPADLATAEGEFAQRVRHDLRTPLTNIIGRCEICLEDAPGLLLEGFVDDLNRILALGKELLVSIDPLLGFSGITPDEVPPELFPELTPPPRPATPAEIGKILVADDNANNRYILDRRLRRAGHEVVQAENGRQAMELARAHTPDLILLDIIMPEMNGFHVLEQLKADEKLRHVPVIIISAFGEVDSVVRCIERGAEDYLAKPFNPVLLQARINACLEKKRLRDREAFYLEKIRKEQERADALLHVILPGQIVTELKETNRVQPRRFEQVAVLFCDIVGFTPFCDRSEPEYVVQELQQLIEAWEEIALRNQVEKIKTIGDAFMAAAGLLHKTEDPPVLHCARCGMEMIAACQNMPVGWNLRVGIHLGPVIAGVIGNRQYLFDLWGDTVNTAARMENHGRAGSVVLSEPAWKSIAPFCRGESLGIVPVKGKPPMEMFRFEAFVNPGGDQP